MSIFKHSKREERGNRKEDGLGVANKRWLFNNEAAKKNNNKISFINSNFMVFKFNSHRDCVLHLVQSDRFAAPWPSDFHRKFPTSKYLQFRGWFRVRRLTSTEAEARQNLINSLGCCALFEFGDVGTIYGIINWTSFFYREQLGKFSDANNEVG